MPKSVQESPLIYQSIVNIMKKVQAIPKASKNSEQGFMYRSVDDVMVELHDIMAQEGVFCVPVVLSTTDSKKIVKSGAEWNHVKSEIAYDFFAVDGSSIRSVLRGEALDSGDKASNKALAIALKYALTQIFMIPTKEDKDPDAHSPSPIMRSTPSTRVVELGNGKTTYENVDVDITDSEKPKQSVYINTSSGSMLSRAYFAKMKQLGIESEEAKEKVKKAFKLNSYTEVTKDQLQTVMKSVDEKVKKKDENFLSSLDGAVEGL